MSDFKKGDKCLLFTTKCIVKKVYHESQEALINDYGDFYDRADFDELALDPEPLLNKIAELEQQLSNSISKDEVRGLIEEYERGNFTAGCECGNIEACDILVDLSELLTNKEEG